MQTPNLKKAAFFALCSLAMLLIGAIWFYQERMLLADAPWVVYYIINTKMFFIQQHRYGSFITQLFPLTGVWMHLSLKAILIIYSISFNLFYFCSALILYVRKQYALVLLLGFYHLLCVTDSYYWTNNEVHQGITWMCLMFAVMLDSHNSARRLISFGLLGFLAIFSHPIVILISGFTFIFLLLTNKVLQASRSTYYHLIIVVLLISVKYYFSINGYYDGEKISNISTVSKMQLRHVFDTCTAQAYFKSCINEYWSFSIITICSFICLIWQKRIAAAVWCIISFVVYFFSICIIYPNCDVHFYIESEWMAMSIISVLPFILFVMPAIGERWRSILTVALLSSRLVQIFGQSEKFEQRVVVIKKIVQKVQQEGKPKIILTQTKNDMLTHKLLMTWGLPIETLIWSNIKGPQKKSVTIAHLHETEIPRFMQMSGNQRLINAFDTQHYTKLNPEYFWFDTTVPYQFNESLKFIK